MRNTIGVSRLRFLRGSKKYFISGLVFPREANVTLSVIYNFCRKADDLVDESPDDNYEQYYEFKTNYHEYLRGEVKGSTDPVIKKFVDVAKKCDFQDNLVESLFRAIEMDISGREYKTIEDLYEYTYGVAEVVGLMVCRAFQVPEAADNYARLAGRAAQWANFLRDIGVDQDQGRQYFSSDLLQQAGLESLAAHHVKEHDEAYRAFIHTELDRWSALVSESQEGYRYLPGFLIKALEIATALDRLVIEQIRVDPFIVYDHPPRPGKIQTVKIIAKHLLK